MPTASSAVVDNVIDMREVYCTCTSFCTVIYNISPPMRHELFWGVVVVGSL